GPGRPEGALELFERAVTHQKAALAVSPKNTVYREFLDNYYDSLGTLQRRMKLPGAEENFRLAVGGARALAADHPQAPEYQSRAGAALHNFALLLMERREWPQALAALEEAVGYQQAAVNLNPRSPKYRKFL